MHRFIIRGLQAAIILAAICSAHPAHAALYDVQEALNDALADDLKYVGKFIPHGSESGIRPICVYRGKKVVIYSSYCVKYAVGAVAVRIHSVDKSKGAVRIYAEAQDRDDITSVKRTRYSDYGFSIAAYENGAFDFNWSIAKLRSYDTKLALHPSPACLSSRTAPKFCKASLAAASESWTSSASQFWDKPTDNWYALIKKLKSKVR